MDIDDPLVKSRPRINPYRTSAALTLKRLMWDFNPQSWSSRRRLKSLLNARLGEKAVILCNGPSLNKVDFTLLDGQCYTFGLNKINLLFNKTSFRPSSITAVNALVIDQNKDFYNNTKIPLFLDSYALSSASVKAEKTHVYLHSSNAQSFAKDCSISINQGYTVTYVAMQLAFHMGFSEVALVGCDHSFASVGAPNKLIKAEEFDSNHFDPTYFSGGVNWNLPDLFESEVYYGRAKKIFEAHDRKIYNCTEGGKLEIFPRLDIKEFLNK